MAMGSVPVVFGLAFGWLGPYPVLEEQHMAEKDQVRKVNPPLGSSRGLQTLSFGIHVDIYWSLGKELALILLSGCGSFCF